MTGDKLSGKQLGEYRLEALLARDNLNSSANIKLPGTPKTATSGLDLH